MKTESPKRKPGRPSKYSDELAERICAEVAKGLLLPQVLKGEGMPSIRSVFLWLTKLPEFSQAYARARESQCETIAGQLLEIADVCRPGKKVKHTVCTCCKGTGLGVAEEGDEERPTCERCNGAGGMDEVVTADMVERARLQLDTRKWLLSKMFPKKYGERLELAGDKDNPLVLSVAEVLRARRQKRQEQAP